MRLGLGKCNQVNPDNIGIQLMPFAATPNESNVYKVWVTPVDKYAPSNPNSRFGFLPSWSKTDNFKCPPPVVDPPPPPPATCTIVVNKYYDANANGFDDGEDETPLDGFQFSVCYTPPGSSIETCQTIIAGANGLGQALLDIPPGSYVTVKELIPQTAEEECIWVQTQPNDQSGNATVIDNQWSYEIQTPADIDSVHTLVFGNVTSCEATKAKSTGYWKSSTGKAKLSKKDPSWRKNLNKYPLRKISGSIYKVPTSGEFADAFASFRSWMAASSYTNMANQLSQQAVAVRLSILYNGLNCNHHVRIPDDAAALIGAEEPVMQIKTVLQLAVESLDQYGKTPNWHAQRPYQEGLKIILKAISLERSADREPDAGRDCVSVELRAKAVEDLRAVAIMSPYLKRVDHGRNHRNSAQYPSHQHPVSRDQSSIQSLSRARR